MTEESTVPSRAPRPPWFARNPRRGPQLLFYRVNRRPLPQGNLFYEQPADVLDHVTRCLLFGGEGVISGSRNQRVWKLGNRAIDLDRRLVSGQVGYQSLAETTQDRYDEDTQEWVEATEETPTAAFAPFTLDAETRILGVLKHPSFSAGVLAGVFEALLRRGEEETGVPTTEWGVEPILDETDFVEWLHAAEVVQEVTFTAKLPNPSGLAEFGPVWERLERMNSEQIREVISARKTGPGLQNVEEDETSSGYIAMASHGYGTIRARRLRQNRVETYNQTEKVKSKRIEDPPISWLEIGQAVVRLVLGERSNGS